MTDFPYKNKDCNSKPAVLRVQQMKNKESRRVTGTFAEIAQLIRSATQVLFDIVKNSDDPYYKWLIQIRRFLRFTLMSKISEQQVMIVIFVCNSKANVA